MMRPRGIPPTPSAMSSAIEPVGTVSTASDVRCPRRMTEPLPNCFSNWLSASSSVFCLSATGGNVFLLRCVVQGEPLLDGVDRAPGHEFAAHQGDGIHV